MGDASKTEAIQASTPKTSDTSWKLQRFDTASQHMVIRGTWLFAKRLEPERLKATLPELLSYYPHLAGRLLDGKQISFNNAGVPFTEKQRNDITLEALQADHTLADKLAPKLSWTRFRRGKEAPLQITISHLPDGDVLTAYVAHACMDGISFYTMIKQWSDLCTGQAMTPPLLDQSLHDLEIAHTKEEAIAEAKRLGWKKISLWSLLTALPHFIFGNITKRARPIHLSEEGLKRLRLAAVEETGKPELSNIDALSAHLARMCAGLIKLSDGVEFSQVIVADTRQRFEKLPPHFVGNAAFGVRGADFFVGQSLGEVAVLNHEMFGPFLTKPSAAYTYEYKLASELMHYKSLWLPYNFLKAHSRRPQMIYLNSFAKFPIYEVDFGGDNNPNPPVYVIPHVLPDPVLIWPAPPARGGIEVFLTGALAKALMRLSSDDPWWQEMLQFETGEPRLSTDCEN